MHAKSIDHQLERVRCAMWWDKFRHISSCATSQIVHYLSYISYESVNFIHSTFCINCSIDRCMFVYFLPSLFVDLSYSAEIPYNKYTAIISKSEYRIRLFHPSIPYIILTKWRQTQIEFWPSFEQKKYRLKTEERDRIRSCLQVGADL